MDHEDTPRQMLTRLMHVGQLLANVAALEDMESEGIHSINTSHVNPEDIQGHARRPVDSKRTRTGRKKHSS